MIYLYSGTPGSGKSLDMARLIYYKSENHPVICNFPVHLPTKRKQKNFHLVFDEDLCPEDLVRFALDYFNGKPIKEEQILLCIDEAQILFNTREWSRKDRKGWLHFFSMHRHYGYMIVLACQMDGMLDKQIRGLIETEVKHRKVNNMGWMGVFLRILKASPVLFLKIHIYYPIKEKTRSEFFRYSKKFATIYDTYDTSFFDLGENAERLTTQGAKTQGIESQTQKSEDEEGAQNVKACN